MALLSAWIVLLTLFYSTLSGPLRATGFYRLFEHASDLSRAGRVVMVYHTLAVPFVAVLALLHLWRVPLRQGRRNAIVHALFSGAMLASAAGVAFAYAGGGMIAHGLYITGLAVVFYAGLNLTLAIPLLHKQNPEKTAFLFTYAAVLVSAVIGAAAGAYFGSSFEAVLAEDIVRAGHSLLDLAVISHLHIMLALIAAVILLLLAVYYPISEKRKRVFYFLYDTGVVITSLATWAVLVFEKTAHRLINVGAVFLLTAAAVFAAEKIALMLKEKDTSPFRWFNFTYLWLVNLFVTAPGVYVAFNLEKYRSGPFEVERTIAVGHWHVLGGICALMTLMLLADIAGYGDRLTRAAGWVTFAGFTSAFILVNVYMFSGKVESYMLPFEIVMGAGFVAAVFLGIKTAARLYGLDESYAES